MAKKSFKGIDALLIGNGINQLETNHRISWAVLLKTLSDKFNSTVDLKNILKPFPLAFEEILFSNYEHGDINTRVRKLKVSISEIFSQQILTNTNVHFRFMDCGIKEIMTTNYDYNLETSVNPNFVNEKHPLNKQEPKHSLYRGYQIGGVIVRHIHGELKHTRKIISNDGEYPEESIMIGFEHYSSYFKRIQDVIHGESGKHTDNEKKSLLVRIRDLDNEIPKIWTDLFFTHRLIIVGFSFNFSENHLWWILLERTRLMSTKNDHDIEIDNEIIFCFPYFKDIQLDYNISNEARFNEIYELKIGMQVNQGIADILKSLNVSIQPIDCKTYQEYYLKVIEKYSQ